VKLLGRYHVSLSEKTEVAFEIKRTENLAGGHERHKCGKSLTCSCFRWKTSLLFQARENSRIFLSHQQEILMSNKQLWTGAAVLIVGGLVTKQLIWTKVSSEVKEIRDDEHKKAHTDLHAAYSRAQQFQLPPLTQDEREKLKDLGVTADLSKFNQRDMD
jgi:hypothetical protein